MSDSSSGFCSHCGSKVEPDDVFCVNCGAKLDSDRPASPTTPSNSDPVLPAKKPQNKAVRLLVAAVIIALAFAGGKLLAGQMAKDYKNVNPEPIATTLPLRTIEPITTIEPLQPFTDGIEEALKALDSIGSSKVGWDIKSATDADIDHALDLYFCGKNGNAFASLFMDPNNGHGGLYFKNSEHIMMWLGRWDIEEDADDHLTLINNIGTRIFVSVTRTGEMTFKLNAVDDTPMNVDMKQGDSGKDNLRKFLIKKKNGVY